jgi:predicted kinase
MVKVLHLVRGLPGAGKSTLAATLGEVFEADQYFEREGRYVWRAAAVPLAHQRCQSRVDAAMREGRSPLVVSNTSITQASMAPYVAKATAYGYRVVVHDLYDGGLTDHELFQRNRHHVPLAKISSMRRAYERSR